MKMITLLGNGIAQLVIITLLSVISAGNESSFILTPSSEERFSPLRKKPVESSREDTSKLISIESLDTWMIEMLDLVNEERSKVGASPLCYNQKIVDAADKHSHDMEENNYFSHTGKDGSSPGDRIDRENYDWSSYGENIAWGQGSVAAVMNAWMNSSGHKANILSGSKTHFGAGWAKSSNKWTQVFSSTWDSSEGCITSNTPTQNPTTSPVSTSSPTLSPVSTSSSSVTPTVAPSLTCEDTKESFKMKIKKKKSKKMKTFKLRCKKVGKKKYCNKKTTDGKRGFELCPVTCGKC